MKRLLVCCGAILLVAVPARAWQEAPAAPKRILDLWDAAYLDGVKTGYQHTTVEQIERDGKKTFHTTKYVHLTLKRYNGIVVQRWALTTDETAAGKVIGVSMTHYLDRGNKIVQDGRVEGEQLLVRTPTDPDGKAVPWKEGVIGFYGQELLFQTHKAKPGDSFRFLDYQMPLLTAVEQRITIKKREQRDVLVAKGGEESRGAWEKKTLLRAEVRPQKVKVGKDTVPLPGLVVWLDDKLRAVRSESDVPLLGRMTMYRTTRELAEKQGVAPAQMADLGLRSIVSLNRALDRPHQAREIVYRITVKDDDNPTTTFAHDHRQSVENAHGNTFDLRVRAVRAPVEVENPAKIDEAKYLKSSYFLDSGNAKVHEKAALLVGEEKDAWRKAQRIEKWVHEHMKGNTQVNFAPASQVLRDLEGDCRQNAMLTAALCRAVGVPARTAVGLVYVNDRENGPLLGFHMWSEVWVRGQWMMLDSVLGQGNVGAGHLKIADHSWQDIQTLAPLLPVTRVTGKVRVEIVEVK